VYERFEELNVLIDARTILGVVRPGLFDQIKPRLGWLGGLLQKGVIFEPWLKEKKTKLMKE